LDIENLFSRAVSYAIKLVKTPSLSGKERELAYLLKEILESEVGVDRCFIDEFGSVIAVIKGGLSSAIMFEGHMDHVPPGRADLWRVPPYFAKVVNGRIYGRGVVDMKASIASMLSAASSISRWENDLSLYLVFVVHEETVEGVALRHVVEKFIKEDLDLVVLGEPTNLNLGLGHRGRCLIKADLFGKTAHASMPHLGVNAIVSASHLIKELSELSLPDHPMLGRATITPISIDCSPKMLPQLPDHCSVVFDRRMIVGESEESVLRSISDILECFKLNGVVEDFSIGVLVEELNCWTGVKIRSRDFFPAWLTSESHPLICRVQSELKRCGVPANSIVWEFSTDGVFCAGEAGILTFGFGPGDPKLAHQPNEHIEVEQLKYAVKGFISIFNVASSYLTLSSQS